ncbi:MAG: DegT/DnrJ/EryC1/StrS family aminotransferase [Sneathiella sp.]
MASSSSGIEEKPFVPVFVPSIEDGEFKAAHTALENGWLGMGSFVQEFEARTKSFLQLKDRHTVAVSTGHAAIHLGLLLAGVGPGDEVITPSFNNIADFQAILATGAEIVFCDIDEDTLCIDLDSAESLITDRTKIMIVMDYGVHVCDHQRASDIAKKHNIKIFHDAAHAFGTTYKGEMLGNQHDYTMFSFDPVKTITTIDGGLLVVKSEEEMFRLHGMRLVGMGQKAATMYQNKRAWTYDVTELGFRYHMANLHASIGLSQMDKVEKMIENRRKHCRFYEKELSGLAECIIPTAQWDEVAPFLFYVRVPAEKREDFKAHLGKHGIDTGLHWQPGHWFELFSKCRKSDLSVTERIALELVTIPLHSNMTQETLEQVTTAIKSFWNEAQ